jgi:hypothetical protein
MQQKRVFPRAHAGRLQSFGVSVASSWTACHYNENSGKFGMRKTGAIFFKNCTKLNCFFAFGHSINCSFIFSAN